MGRPVRLSFAGAAEIPAVPYVKTQEREAEVPAVPGIPGIPGMPAHPGIPAGGGAGWLLGNMKVNNDRPPADFLSSGHFSWNFAQWNDNDRWAGTGNTYTSANSMRAGISHIAVSTNDQNSLDREAILLNIQTLPIVLLQAHGGTGLAVSIEFQISNREIIQANNVGFHNFILFTVSAQGFTIGDDPQVHPFSEFSMIDPELGGANFVWGGFQDFSPWPNRIAILGTGEGTGATPAVPASYRRQYSPALTLGRVVNTDGIITPAGGFSSWSIRNVADYEAPEDIIPATLAGNWLVSQYPQVFDIGYREEPLVDGDSYCDIDISGQGFVPGDGIPNPWSIKIRAAKYSLHPTVPPSDTMFIRIIMDNDPPNTDPEYTGNQVLESQVGNARWGHIITFRIQSFLVIQVSPAIPYHPGSNPSPEIPPFGGTPDIPPVLGIPGIPLVPAIYENALYGRPAIPAFGIWAERLGMTMTHRVENELEIIDLEISGHDYLIRQDWVAPKDHRIRPFCWMQDERGIVQTVETADQTDEKTTRFSTLAIVNGPANATSPPLPADLQEGDDLIAPGFRIQPEVINHVLEVHEDIGPQQETVITEVQVRVGWALTSFAVEKVLTRDDNHPADGAVLTTIDTPFRTPPYPPALATEGSLYLHIWVSGLIDPLSFLLGGANQISGWTRIGRLVVDGVSGALYVSDHLLSEAINQFDFEVRLTNA